MMTDIVEVIRDFDRAYPEDVFPFPDEKTRLEVRDLYPGFIDGISAGMGRHIASKIQPAADEIETLRQRVKELEKANKLIKARMDWEAGRAAKLDVVVNDFAQIEAGMEAELAELRKIIYNFVGRDFAHLEPREALEAHQAEMLKAQGDPVAWMYVNTDGECEQIEYGKESPCEGFTPLYTSAPKP